MSSSLSDPTLAELSILRADELNRIHRELIVIIRDAGPGSHVAALAGVVSDLASLVAAATASAAASASRSRALTNAPIAHGRRPTTAALAD